MNDRAGEMLAHAGTASPFDAVEAFLRRYVVFASDAQVTACVLYVAHTWAIDAAEVTPYLGISSAEPQSGKSRLLEVLETLVRDAWPVVSPTPAVMFRGIDARQPTLLWDEIDTLFSQRGQFEDLRAILNAGFRRGARVPRWNADRNGLEDFGVFCPKVLAGIGEFPDTIADRSIPIRLRRRVTSEEIARFRQADRHTATPIREALEKWARESVEALTGAAPPLPDELGDRAQDAWEPLIAIADLAGDEWPERARDAAIALATARVDNEESFGVQLLRDVQQIFDVHSDPNIASQKLVDNLLGLEGAPWEDYRYGRGLNTHSLNRLLEPFEIHSKTVRIGQRTVQGFQQSQFEDAWRRWLALPTPQDSATSQHPSVGPGAASGADESRLPF
jgi:hypothetical protein